MGLIKSEFSQRTKLGRTLGNPWIGDYRVTQAWNSFNTLNVKKYSQRQVFL